MAACFPSRTHFITARKATLGFSVANVAAQKPVHRHRTLHICLYLVDTPDLIVSFGVFEGRLKLGLPLVVGRKSVSRKLLACGVKLNQLRGKVLCSASRARLCLLPVCAVHFRQLNRLILAAADIF
jgi:hypothetical protein